MLLGAAQVLQETKQERPFRVVTFRVSPTSAAEIVVELSCPAWRPFAPQVCPIDVAALEAVAADADQYGERLGRALFDGSELGRQFEELRIGLLNEGGGFRVRLRLDDPRASGLRWERLMVPWGGGAWRALATLASTPLSRVAYYDTTVPLLEPIEERTLRALLVIASPSDLPSHLGAIQPADREVAKQALRALGPEVLELTVLESGTGSPPSIDRLRAELARAPHLIHVLCHGEMTADAGVLYVEDAAGQCYGLSGATFAEALQSAGWQHPRLVTLAACESASPSSAEGTRAVAPILVARGADAVLAMHGPVTVKTAAVFTSAFYQRLYAHGQADVAAAEARAAVKEAWDWSVPVLFMRQDDGRVIEFDIGSMGRGVYARVEPIARDLQTLPDAASRGDPTAEVLEAMDALQGELGKSHEFLVRLADGFRRTGSEPAAFKSEFETFRLDFEREYDRTTWTAQQTSCHRVGEAWAKLRPFFASLMGQGRFDPETFRRLDEVMGYLASADADTIAYMGQLLDTMKAEVDDITDRLDGNDVAGAIAAKRAFERRLSDSFRRSKEFLQTIARHVHTARAA